MAETPDIAKLYHSRPEFAPLRDDPRVRAALNLWWGHCQEKGTKARAPRGRQAVVILNWALRYGAERFCAAVEDGIANNWQAPNPRWVEVRHDDAAEEALDGRPSPADAWAEVFGAIADVGYLGSPKWSDPCINEAVRLFGSWESFCKSATVSDRMSNRARFLEAYKDARYREKIRAQSARAEALVEADMPGLLDAPPAPEVNEKQGSLIE